MAFRTYTTRKAAEILQLRDGTLRHAYQYQKHYSGIYPVKLPNGHLRWPADQVDAFVRCEVTK